MFISLTEDEPLLYLYLLNIQYEKQQLYHINIDLGFTSLSEIKQ
jgi:hypothetical protein